jgi:hypothetical protein
MGGVSIDISIDIGSGQPKTQRAVQDVAARYGISLPDHMAAAIARAVLECADDEHRVTCGVTPSIWERPDAKAAVTANLKRRMAVELADAGMLPTALPREVVTHPGGYPWEEIKVELVVPVRRPPA